ncbi:MAG TPA: helix-turn-helix transcriptional regulator [Actinocrinis sp.]|nr:helix-turn-helix transcriptional regulator [Actinocrinis sp.]
MNEYDTAHGDGASARLALARALREMHKRSNRTLRAVERDISISDSTLSRYFRGKAVPSWSTVEKICASFGEDPASVRELWAVAIAERSNADFPAADPAVAALREPASSAAGRDEKRGEDRAATGGGGTESADGARSALNVSARVTRLRRGIMRVPRSRAASLVTGLVLGVALGAGATALAMRGSNPPAAQAQSQAPTQIHSAPALAGTVTYCPWKYVVTDGTADNVRVYDDPQRDSIIARYAPNEVFYVAEPPQIVNGMLRTEHGWIGTGSWVQRYTGSTCRTGSS